MKKALKLLFVILLAVFVIVAEISYGQILKKDAVVAVSSYTLVLNPDVTMNQFLDFYLNKYIPEFEKNYPGIKAYWINGDRGEKSNKIGEIWLFESTAVSNKYFAVEDDTTMTDAYKVASEKMDTMDRELGEYVVSWNRVYTDWVIK